MPREIAGMKWRLSLRGPETPALREPTNMLRLLKVDTEMGTSP